MKTIISIVALMAGVVAAGTAAAEDFDDYARVVNVASQMEQVETPGQECRTDYVQAERGSGNASGALIGAIAGGLLGNRVGGGSGRAAATAIGVMAGAIVGDSVQNNGHNGPAYGERPVQRCRTVMRQENRENGYLVTYEYRGRAYTSLMPYDPGERVRLHVSVAPVL